MGTPPMDFLRGRLHRDNGRLRVAIGGRALELATPSALTGRADGEVVVGIRAENIEAAADRTPGALEARTDVLEPLRSHLLVTAAVGDQRLKLQTRIDFPAQPHHPLWLRPDPDKLRWFDPATGRELGAG